MEAPESIAGTHLAGDESWAVLTTSQGVVEHGQATLRVPDSGLPGDDPYEAPSSPDHQLDADTQTAMLLSPGACSSCRHGLSS